VQIIKATLLNQNMVVIEWAWRQQGFVVAANNPLAITSLSDLAHKKARLIDRQSGTGSKVLLDYLLDQEKIAGGKADAGIAVASVAKQLRLDFTPADN
jgi:molybdate-binding protein